MTEETADTILLELAADLVVAWLSNTDTRVSAEDLPAVIRKIHGALAGLGSSAGEDVPAKPEYVPAVSVRRSLASKDHIISLIDGKPYKALRRHLTTNGLTPEQYRERYNLKPDYPMVSESYSEVRRNMAMKIGLGRKPGTGAAAKPAAKSAAKPRAPRRAKAAAPPAPAET